ncbi:CpaE family protein [Bacillus sp. NPDC094106]|uniref:AAA family ATPase n=1 Tax=Bacillus sp. NPDC094106 TaxID=3363949 RepID=UPI00382BF006
MNKVNKGKMVVCYPVLYGNGMKYTATNIAHYYKQQHSECKVALVDFDFKIPYLGASFSLEDKVHGIDNLIEKIDGGFLNEELFKENMTQLKNKVDLLKGTKLLKNFGLIEKRHVDRMIEILKSLYDFIVVTVSPQVDNAGTVNALFHADDIVLIGRNNFSNLQMIPSAIKTVDHFKQKDASIKMIFNMFNEQSNIDFSECFNGYDVKVVGMIPYNESTIDNGNLMRFGAGVTNKFFQSKKQNEYASIIEEFE